MDRMPWLNSDLELPGAGKGLIFLYGRSKWQILTDNANNRVLVAKPSLMTHWIERKLIPPTAHIPATGVSGEQYSCFVSPADQRLSPLRRGDLPRAEALAVSLAEAFRDSRALDPQFSFVRGIYSSLYGKILPTTTTYRDDDQESDALAFGSWMAGDAPASARNFQLLSSMVTWLSSERLQEILDLSGVVKPLEAPKSDVTTYFVSTTITTPLESTFNSNALVSQLAKPKTPPTPTAKPLVDENGVPRVFSLPGRRVLERFFREHIIDIVQFPEKYRKLGVDYPTGTLLYGPPGCGKTYAVQKLVEFLGWHVSYVNSSSIASPYIHETSKKISHVFDKAIRHAPSFLVIDEMEAYLGARSGDSSSKHHIEEVGEFLRRIPEALDKKVIIIAMTNMLETIDLAVLRQGRFDHKIGVEFPDAEEVRDLFALLLKDKPLAADASVDFLVEKLVRRPLSDAAFVVREASRLAARNDKEALDMESFRGALRGLPDPKRKAIGY
ncbi:MAG: ATP-binding protein [Deltaproteobacteria bacterium]|jgi:Cdc6-like AAA superfamily ATPase|nr:ATP-binding protein [Deltaproteobacteria bacterium]